jgi:2-polyprenyl-3-methyl-5-hydroxy-6-metoxy-1,4-benzoquinol methylase
MFPALIGRPPTSQLSSVRGRVVYGRGAPSVEVAAFVRADLPEPPARVLEVGAGQGELARMLVGGGYRVVAIDPDATADVMPVALVDLAAHSHAH